MGDGIPVEGGGMSACVGEASPAHSCFDFGRQCPSVLRRALRTHAHQGVEGPGLVGALANSADPLACLLVLVGRGSPQPKKARIRFSLYRY